MTEDSQYISSVRIADDALVVRGGQNRIQDLQRGIGTHPGEIRELGGDVIRTSGRSLFHATLTGLTPENPVDFLHQQFQTPHGEKDDEKE